MPRKTAKERFGEMVRKTDTCWLWTGSCDRDGYGRFWSNKFNVSAHRYSYQIHYGFIPDGLFVLHSCDTPACVNPDHLWLGTNQDNMDDMVNKGRCIRAKGENSGNAKMTINQVRSIREKHKRKITYKELANEYGVTKQNIGAVVNRKTWRHVE